MLARPGRWSKRSRRLTALFLVVFVPAAATLVALGVILIGQDRRLVAQRVLEQREAAVDAAVRSLKERLDQARVTLAGRAVLNDGVPLTFTKTAVETRPANALVWTPTPRQLIEADTTTLLDAERAELSGIGDRGRATYEATARSRTPTLRASALLRLARLHRTDGKPVAAIEAYEALATIPGVAFEGMPADLLARRAICGLLDQMSRPGDRRACAEALARDLVDVHWSLDYGSWRVSVDQVEEWLQRPLPFQADSRALSYGASMLWRAWRQRDGAPFPSSGVSAWTTPDGLVTIAWSATNDALSAAIITPSLMHRWVQALAPPSGTVTHHVDLATEDGAPLHTDAHSRAADVSERRPATTGLPWTVAVTSIPTVEAATELNTRARLLAVGLVAIVLLLTSGAVLILRVVERELAVARLHTDFVAAVSHEFRTPLASLQHVGELLAEDDGVPPQRRRSLYGVIGRSTARLNSLVESLLDFARMEEGRAAYRLTALDASRFSARVVEDFRSHLDDGAGTIRIDDIEPDLWTRADSEALAHALWNLLDNAVKYSSRPCLINVRASRRGSSVAIAVEDHGPGVPEDEQRDIFQRFVRGRTATRLGVRGTGLGLAMVSHIVAAHHGSVELESEEGRGSTFRIVLPLVDTGGPLNDPARELAS